MGVSGATAMALAGGSRAAEQTTRAKRGREQSGQENVWLFWDLWHLDRRENVAHCQGEPQWQPEATFAPGDFDGLACWPTVYRDHGTDRWRMFYSTRWKPYSLHVAESEDGRNWQPLPVDAKPAGGQKAENHIFTLPHGSGGAVYLDPLAKDGFPFKVFAHQQGEPVYERALKDPGHRWHEIARRSGAAKRYMSEELTCVSRDGLHWEARLDRNWGFADWHPEPPIFGFYNRHRGRHMMTVRPGWGDRRVCLQSTADFEKWSGPELLLQPDPLDEELIELYGMPVFPYGGGYVGLLWIFHCPTSEPTRSFNRFVGPLDCQLSFSSDGVRFFRGFRRPFIARNEDGEYGGGAIQPCALVETEEELRIYSASSKLHHGKRRSAARDGHTSIGAILLHTLRKDGFVSLRSEGAEARLVTKPLAVFGGTLRLNAKAPVGRVEYRLLDVESRPLAGFTFEECRPLEGDDQLAFPLQWKTQSLDTLAATPVRLELRFRHAELFALRGEFHFLDAQDMWMLRDGQEIQVTGGRI